jgi:hypothetical protein
MLNMVVHTVIIVFVRLNEVLGATQTFSRRGVVVKREIHVSAGSLTQIQLTARHVALLNETSPIQNKFQLPDLVAAQNVFATLAEILLPHILSLCNFLSFLTSFLPSRVRKPHLLFVLLFLLPHVLLFHFFLRALSYSPRHIIFPLPIPSLLFITFLIILLFKIFFQRVRPTKCGLLLSKIETMACHVTLYIHQNNPY